jgi:pimeloyl-ACP methyl ester carboxylesterase
VRFMTSNGGLRSLPRAAGPLLIRTGLALAERAAPGLGARAAVRMCMTVPSTVPRNGVAVPVVECGSRLDLPGPHANITTEVWGDGPVVYMLHGWGDNRRSWYPFVGPLTCAGFRVVTLDAPGHGDSGPGAYGPGRTVLPEMISGLWAATKRHGPAHAVVAHSLGALATAVACLDGLPADRLVLIAPPPDLWSAIRVFVDAAGVGQRVQARMPQVLHRLMGIPFSHFDAMKRAAEEEALPPALIIHDGGDRRVPFALAAQLATAWPQARLHRTDGLGHNRILCNEEVIAASEEFLAAARVG